MKKKPLILTSIALFVFFGAIFGVIAGKQMMIGRFLATFRPPPVTVSAEPARTEHRDVGINAVGTLKAVQGVDLATETAGIVVSVQVRAGDTVAAGTELVTLDDRVEVATLKSLMAQRRLAEINFERDQRLLKNSSISRLDFDKTEALLKDINAQVERTEAIIARKHIKAPFAGRIGIPQIDAGQYVEEGRVIVTLQALDMLEVDFNLPEQHLPSLRPGIPVRGAVQAFPDTMFEGQLTAIDAKVDANTRNVLVRARVPNSTLALLPGMFVSVEVITEAAVPMVTVPESAISYNLYGDSVFVIGTQRVEAEDGGGATSELVVKRRYIKVGDSRDGRVAIADGLAAGERVVTAGTLKLDNGARVTVDAGKPARP